MEEEGKYSWECVEIQVIQTGQWLAGRRTPKRDQAADTDLRFAGIDILMEVMINFLSRKRRVKPKGLILDKLLNISEPVLLPIM